MQHSSLYLLFPILLLLAACSSSRMINKQSAKQMVLTTNEGNRLRITAYGPSMLRLQFAFKEDFLPIDYREMIKHHNWQEPLQTRETPAHITISTGKAKAVIDKQDFSISFYQNENQPVLVSNGFAVKIDSMITYGFTYNGDEHFAGLGHDYMGRLESLDLKGKTHRRNYAHSLTRFTDWKYSQQAPLIVPFYFSSRGYGIFLNSTFTNYFNLGENNQYEMGISTHGVRAEMDFVFIAGPEVKNVVENYTSLTGKPRLPSMSVLGLQLTDKVHDHSHKTPSDEQWWKNKVQAHRSLGLAIDHLINDNRWRAQGGQRCISVFEWERQRFPDPATYARWLRQNNLTITLDWNRCISAKSEGWKESYNLQGTIPFHEFSESAPDFSNPGTRKWMWELFRNKAIDTTLGFPVDGLWIDEVDEMYTIPYRHQMAGGKWGELANYWFMLVAQSLVKNGWDPYFQGRKRPYVWMRGATAGMQRYATMWSGDIDTDYEEMRLQVRGMQSAGISGFAFWGHDAGGFIDHSRTRFKESPVDSVYARWSMQLGAFSPIWKPHGMGQSRWPEDRSAFSKQVAEKYTRLRYTLMPYTYSYAHIAATTGLPLVRPMLLEYANVPAAWQYDSQFMYGENILVAPMFDKPADVWLPDGQWYYFWNDSIYNGDKNLTAFNSPLDELPLWIKAGSIIPMYNYALSTFDVDKTKLNLHVYTGADGSFTLTEDDGETEYYKQGQKMETVIAYANRKLTINKSTGSYENAPAKRSYQIVLLGVDPSATLNISASVNVSVSRNNQRQVVLTVPATALAETITVQW